MPTPKCPKCQNDDDSTFRAVHTIPVHKRVIVDEDGQLVADEEHEATGTYYEDAEQLFISCPCGYVLAGPQGELWHCGTCGGTDIEETAWREINTNSVTSFGQDGPRDVYFCNDCDAERAIVSHADFLQAGGTR